MGFYYHLLPAFLLDPNINRKNSLLKNHFEGIYDIFFYKVSFLFLLIKQLGTFAAGLKQLNSYV